MRITMKGGIWKNSEDEILKAAVMKYGLNNWSRVASLLVRKSAKQCKARWYEWLDPNVKKTEWTREEEEKLLHLAKLFPCQWRTIAPIIGRTSHQCLLHYEKLLDMAQGKSTDDPNDPRRLKPGEIDPAPETKPSRADAVDLDEDEKEMLAEARARLANTRGKKAKRKAREKQMEEARRLAHLQKRIELKAAGIGLGAYRDKKMTIDYGREIPFEAPVPAGFHSVGPEETPEASFQFKNLTLQKIEGRLQREEQERLRKADKRRLKRLAEEDLPQAMGILEKLNDPLSIRKKSRLSLPTPQLSDAELREIVQGSSVGSGASGDSATDHLLAPNQLSMAIAGLTPMRTPMAGNSLMLEAKNAVIRSTLQTPLIGEEAPAMAKVSLGTGAMPNVSHVTPHPLKPGGFTPLTASGRATPLMGRTELITPLRDELSLNPEVNVTKESPTALLKRIRTSLASLPEPENEIEVSLPPPVENVGMDTVGVDEDIEDINERNEILEERQRLELMEKQSAVLKRQLPRPYFVETIRLTPSTFEGAEAGELAAAERMITQEMMSLIYNDAISHPPASGLKAPKNVPPLNLDWSLEDLKTSVGLIDDEVTSMTNEFGEAIAAEAVADMRDLMVGEWVVDPLSRKVVLSTDEEAKARATEKEAKDLQTHLARDQRRSNKLERKLEVLTSGYLAREKVLTASIDAGWNGYLEAYYENEAYRQLEAQEGDARVTRLREVHCLLEREKERNLMFQQQYDKLCRQRDMAMAQVG